MPLQFQLYAVHGNATYRLIELSLAIPFFFVGNLSVTEQAVECSIRSCVLKGDPFPEFTLFS